MIFRAAFFSLFTTALVMGQPDLIVHAALALLAVLGVGALAAVVMAGPAAVLERPVTELVGLRSQTH